MSKLFYTSLEVVRAWYKFLNCKMGWKVEAVTGNQRMNTAIKWNPLS